MKCCQYGTFVVSLMDRVCGSRQWDMTGIPCPHAISTILYHSAKPEQYLHPYYSVENYKMAYDPMIYPVPSEDQWVRTRQDEVDPLVVRAALGRPKKLRRRGPDELRNPHCMRKGGVRMRCSKCRAVGHNAKTCPRRKTKSTPSTATELSFDDVSTYILNATLFCNKRPLSTELIIFLILIVLCRRFLLTQLLMIHSLRNHLQLHNLFYGPKREFHLLLLV
jgi:hypothetical protein